jgi:hypothetical protein
MYADLSNVARDIFSIIPHRVRVKGRFSLWQNSIGWSQLEPTGETLRNNVDVRKYAQANHGIMAGDKPVLDPTEAENDIELTRDAEERQLHGVAKVLNLLELW